MLPILRNIPVLCFHNINTPDGMSLTSFRKHLDTILSMGLKTISAQKLLSICLGEAPPVDKAIVLTFDDCHVSQWIHAVPELERRGMCGVFFAITDFIQEGPLRDVDNPPALVPVHTSFTRALDKEDFSQFMTQEELVATVVQHGMEVYSHTARHQGCFTSLTPKKTVSHHWTTHGIYHNNKTKKEISFNDFPVFPHGSAYAWNGYWPKNNNPDPKTFHHRTDEERFNFCVRDFSDSLAKIKSVNKEKRQLICWPWGHFDRLTIKAAQQAGFHGAFSLERFRNGPGTDPFHLHRIPVSQKKSTSWLRTRLRMYATAPGAMLFCKFYRKK